MAGSVKGLDVQRAALNRLTGLEVAGRGRDITAL
jgi:hypothetical protein